MPNLRVHALYHAPFEGLGAIAGWLDRHGCQLGETRLYAGENLPRVEDLDWLIVMGGPMSIHDETEFPWLISEKLLIQECLRNQKAVLGICLGAQLIASVLGGSVNRNPHQEIGWYPVFSSGEENESKKDKETWLRRIFPDTLMTFHWHGETFSLPENAVKIAYSRGCEQQGFLWTDRVIGLQFHPEMEASGIQKLLAHCDSDRKPGPYVQTDNTVLGLPEYFAANRFFLEELLQGLRTRQLRS